MKHTLIYLPLLILDFLISITTDKTFADLRRETKFKIKQQLDKL